jgi:hypothetical protein
MKNDRMRMKTTIGLEEVSSRPAQEAGCEVKIGAKHGRGDEKLSFLVPKWLAEASVGKDNRKNDSKTQFDAMNNKSNGKSRLTALNLP